jgi:broad specificity phosphatase PhoE
MSSSVGGWSEVAIQAAKGLTQTQRAKLEQEGVMKLKDDRPIRIEARPWKNTHTNNNNEDGIIHKVIHFQRHGQGYHNLLGDMWREMGQAVVLDSPDPAQNPFIRPEIVDSPLTESGRQQCLARRPVAAALSPQAVIVSPLHRAVQTAQLSFADHMTSTINNNDENKDVTTIPWVAHEGCREDLGMLICNKRRPTSQIVSEFGQHGIDFSHMTSEEDDMWSPDAIETPHAKSKRVYEFLTDFIRHRPETELAVVTHSAWLFNMCNAVMDIIEEEEQQMESNNNDTPTTPLASWFLTSEIRSMHVSFIEK